PPAPRKQGAGEAGPPGGRPRMVRRHEYQAIVPDGSESLNWIRMLTISFVCVMILTIGVYLFLKQTSIGQVFMASMGREASAEAYHIVGKRYMENGSISRAIHALEIAQSKDPDKLELLVDLGKAYMGNNQVDRAELMYTRAIHNYPAYPEPYQHVIDIMLDKALNYEAIQLVRLAYEKTGDQRFESMLSRLLPPAPTVSLPGKRYNTEIDLELKCSDDGATIYYAFGNDSPIAEGIRYDGPIHLPESSWRIRAVAEKDGMYSPETVQMYTIIKDQPDMPKASLGPGKYSAGTKIRLRAGKDVIAIYYTVDGTKPTTESKLYDDNNPIVLGIGRTIIKAIAVNAEGKASNEFNLELAGTGSPKSSMSEKDTVDGLTLYKTTRDQFVQKYGQPQAETPDGSDQYGEYTKLTYSFGYAVFVLRPSASQPVLAELYTSSSAFSGPRGTGVGTRMEDVTRAFRDHLGEANANGDRVLYNRTSMGQSGFLKKVSDSEYKISYYQKLSNGQYVELTYDVRDGLVIQLEWLQY
ncbi:MAG: chitobiase/beta-hexosaminidase C-terminal domain-containing protein, partial [Firmicutes bacterium]|nr:chitobiase/beta-hexosaminidase C-terminal domain-containing protein [Bacillota bacterium]